MTGGDDDLTLVLGCLSDQQATVAETLPGLMSAAVYAGKLTVVAFEADTLIELPDYHTISAEFGEFFDYYGADSADLPGNPLYCGPGDDSDAITDETLWAESLGISSEEDDLWSLPFEEAIRREQYENALSVAKVVSELIKAPNTMPMLYDPTGLLIEDAERLGTLSRPTKQKLEADAKLGSGLVDRLPSFEKLTAEQIVEIRNEFRDYLGPFRSFVVETSQALVEVVRDEEAVVDVVNEIYVGKVRPAVKSINDEMRQSSFGRSVLRNLGQDPKAFLQSFVTFGLGEVAQLPLGVSVGAAAASTLVSVLSTRGSTRRQLRKDRLYLLHEIGGMIAEQG